MKMAEDADLLKEPVSAEPQPVDGEASAKDEVLSELIELMQSSAATKLPKKEDEDEEFPRGLASIMTTGTN